tara:strand:+ start:3649 stop:5334 length:1686 start_codon:yes stop_codon:yes gene_type:complete
MEQGMLNGQQKQNLKGIASLGRLEDNHLAHIAQGERIIPAIVAENNPKLVKAIDKSISEYGVNPDSFVVGSRNMEINPQTGLPEFGWLSKIAKKLKKVVKKVAPIAAVIPGPWQPFATVYNKANALNNIAKGDASIGDVLTLGAGGSQKVFGDTGALAKIKAGTGIASLGNVSEALKANVGSFMDAPGKYLSNIGEQVAKDQQAGYGGIFQNVNPESVGGQFISSASNLANPLGGTGIMNVVGMQGQMMPVAQGTGEDSGFLDYVKDNFTEGSQRIRRGWDGRPDQVESLHKDGNYYTQDEARNLYNVLKETNQLPGSGSFFGQKTPGWIKSIGDAARGIVGGVKDTFTGQYTEDGKLIKAPTIDPKLLALALGYGKITRDAAIRQSGGMQDIRKTLRPDLVQQAVYNPGGGFDVGIGNPRLPGITNPKLLTMPTAPTKGMPLEANYETMPYAPIGTPMPERFTRGVANGGIVQAYADGGQVLDMRFGGESEGPGTGTSDDIPAMLSDGEFVMTAKATRGAGAFDIAEQDGGIMLLPTGEASREKGTDNMTTLMETFARYG